MFSQKGLPASLYTDRGSHYFVTRKAGEAVDKERLTQVGRALERLGVEHIPAYSPQARGRSERLFSTLQDRLPKELALAGIADVEAANRFIRDVYLPAHNARFARPPEIAESAFVAADPTQLAETLCIEAERVVARDNTVAHAGLRLQLPQSRAARPLRQGARQAAPLPRRHARHLPRPAAPGPLRRRRTTHRAAHPSGRRVTRFDAAAVSLWTCGQPRAAPAHRVHRTAATEADISCATKTGHLHVLSTSRESRMGAARSLVPARSYHFPVLAIEAQGSSRGSASPFCRISMEMLSGERTKAMRPSRGGRLIVTPPSCRRRQVS